MHVRTDFSCRELREWPPQRLTRQQSNSVRPIRVVVQFAAKTCSGFCLAYAPPRGAHDAFDCVPKQGAVQHAFAVDITPHNRNHAASGNIAVAARACNTSYLPASGNPKRNGQQFRKPMRIPNATVSRGLLAPDWMGRLIQKRDHHSPYEGEPNVIRYWPGGAQP